MNDWPTCCRSERVLHFADERGLEKVDEGHEEMETDAGRPGYSIITGALHGAMRNLGRRRGRGVGERGHKSRRHFM